VTAKPKPAGHTTSVTRGNTRTTVTHAGHTTTTTRTTAHGSHRTSVTTVKTGGKVTSTTTRKYIVVKATPKPAGSKKPAPKKRGAIASCAGGFWVTGDNDRLETCVPVALANSLLIDRGLRVADWQIRALAGMRAVTDVLGALGVPFRPAEGLHDGVILGVAGTHAVTVHDGALVSWGDEYPLDGLGAVEEAWEADWR
jgi:hypothetical protein